MLWNNIKSFQSTQKKHKLTFIFFHPDYTVGFGISPNHAFRLVGYTTGRELHPALKIVIQLRTIIISDIISVNKKFFSRLSKYNNLQAGKHRLFLNILLFGKLHVPIYWQPHSWHEAALPVLPGYSPIHDEDGRCFFQYPYILPLLSTSTCIYSIRQDRASCNGA